MEDEISRRQNGRLKWLWTMVNTSVCFFKVHSHRSGAKAFADLIENWRGILIGDDFRLYRSFC